MYLSLCACMCVCMCLYRFDWIVSSSGSESCFSTSSADWFATLYVFSNIDSWINYAIKKTQRNKIRSRERAAPRFAINAVSGRSRHHRSRRRHNECRQVSARSLPLHLYDGFAFRPVLKLIQITQVHWRALQHAIDIWRPKTLKREH